MKKIVTLLAACVAIILASCAQPSTSGSGVGGGGNELTTKSVSNCKSYTMTLGEDAEGTQVGYLLQIDNDGSQNADGLKIIVSNLKLSVKIGDANAVVKDMGTMEMIPDQYANPQYSKTSCRKVIPELDKISKDTKIEIKVINATISNGAKADSIICALQRDGGDYQFFGIDNSENWQPAFAIAE